MNHPLLLHQQLTIFVAPFSQASPPLCHQAVTTTYVCALASFPGCSHIITASLCHTQRSPAPPPHCRRHCQRLRAPWQPDIRLTFRHFICTRMRRKHSSYNRVRAGWQAMGCWNLRVWDKRVLHWIPHPLVEAMKGNRKTLKRKQFSIIA